MTPSYRNQTNCYTQSHSSLSSSASHACLLLLLLASPGPGSVLGNHYDLLGVAKDADVKEMKKAYRRLALELHPDKLLQLNLTSEEVENKTDHFILVQEAYETLTDERKRFIYDSSLSGVSPGSVPPLPLPLPLLLPLPLPPYLFLDR